jgi:hypothetical protein
MALGFDDLTKKVQEIWAPSAGKIIKFLDSPLIAVEMPAVLHDDRFLSQTTLSDEEGALVRFFRSDSEEQPVYLAFPKPWRKPWRGYLESPYRGITAKNLEELFSEAESSLSPASSPPWLRDA